MSPNTATLVQRRLGAAALHVLLDDLLAPVRILWVDERVRAVATSALRAAADRGVSLVDWVSFEVMRARGSSAPSRSTRLRRAGLRHRSIGPRRRLDVGHPAL